jgi:hypothetical protein
MSLIGGTMDAKITLKLDNAHIEKAKMYAAKRRTSLSSLVEKYFAFLTDIEPVDEMEISPTVKKLSGVLTLDAGFDLKDEKEKRLTEKYR